MFRQRPLLPSTGTSLKGKRNYPFLDFMSPRPEPKQSGDSCTKNCIIKIIAPDAAVKQAEVGNNVENNFLQCESNLFR